jgi:predicted P-loop ATPase
VSKYLWTALAGRVLDPGCQADMVPILVGDQGVRKTTSLRALVVSPDHFTEISLSERDDNLSRKMRGRLVGEIGELRGLHSRDLEDIKSFITRTHEVWTPKYREFATTYARRIVLVGTTNTEEFLADPTGNRRWLPVKVGNVDVARIEADRLQLWAEGAVMWLAGGIAWQAAQALAPEHHAAHTMQDTWEDAIREWLDKPYMVGDGIKEWRNPHPDGLKNGERPFTTQEVLVDAIELLIATTNRGHEMRAAKALMALGYRQERKMVGRSRARYWVRASS